MDDTERLLAELVEAGLVTVEVERVTLTQAGEQLARQLAMSGEADRDALMEALLSEATLL